MEDSTIISYQRDRFVPTEKLSLAYWDDVSGTLRGYRVFTACRTVRGKIFRSEDHLRRLYDSAAGIHMRPPMGKDALRDILRKLVQLNTGADPGSDMLLNVIFSGGLEGCTMKQAAGGAHLYIAAQPLIRPDAACYERGVALATFAYQRMYPAVKLLNYVGAIIAHQMIVPQYHAYDVIFVCPEDRETILEGSTFTIFFVDSEGTIRTPPLDGRILDSITRRVVVEILRDKPQFRLRETPVRLGEVPSFREAFLASTSRNVLSVTRVDDLVIGDGSPGPVTRAVHDVFEEYMNSY